MMQVQVDPHFISRLNNWHDFYSYIFKLDTMKKRVLIGLLTINLTAFAQQEQTIESADSSSLIVSDTNVKRYGSILEIIKVNDSIKQINIQSNSSKGKDAKIDKNRSEAHWAGFSVGLNFLTNETQGLSFPNERYWEIDPARSYSYGLNIAEKKIRLIGRVVGITTGVGFTFNSYGFKNNYVLTANQDSVFATLNTTVNYSTNKLKATYLNVPLLLDISSKQEGGFYLVTGVVGGLRLGSKTKRKGKDYSGKSFESKIKDDFHLNTLTLDATLRTGYNDFGIYANYSLTSMFVDGKTATIFPFSIGVVFNF